MYKSSFCGVIEELPEVRVDNFERPITNNTRAYFLSHCHSDHTQGLYNSELLDVLNGTGAFIYMSEPTAAIIEDEATDKRILDFIKILKLGSNCITLPADEKRNYEEKYLTVTTILAGHSFGSVMFLFQTDAKTVLFTGDFRVDKNDLHKYTVLHKNGDPIKLDALYVDTTFLNRHYKNFPRRSESIQAVIEEIRNWLTKDGGAIALHTSAKYGYEFVYNEIFDKLKVKVCVGDERWRLYSKVQHLVRGVTNEPSRLHICRNYTEKKDHSNCTTLIKDPDNTLYIHFSAMKWSNFGDEENTINRLSNNRIDVCFATHCSSSELIYFVKYLAPKRVVGFPENFPDEETRTVTLTLTDSVGSPAKRQKMEKSKSASVNKKVDRELLKKMFEI